MRKSYFGILSVIIMLFVSACDTAVTVGGRTVGWQAGRFIYSDGFMLVKYPYPYERVWAACEKAIEDIKAVQVEKTQGIAAGQIRAKITDETITIRVKYISKKQTSVSVRVGLAGNNLAAQVIHERIARNFEVK